MMQYAYSAVVQDQYKSWPIEPRMAPPPPPMRAHVPFEGTSTSREAFQGWQLPPQFPGIGLEIVGDRMHTLIPRGAALPATGSHVFTTANDSQSELCVLIYAGDNQAASENELLGQFDLTGLPQTQKETLQIEVRLQPLLHHTANLLAAQFGPHASTGVHVLGLASTIKSAGQQGCTELQKFAGHLPGG
jgi:hypothetical protein